MTTLHYGRKADANMWWIIIGAVIALVVLIIMMVIFTGKTNPLVNELLTCESKGGNCLYRTKEECITNLGSASEAFSCQNKNVCCFSSSTTLR